MNALTPRWQDLFFKLLQADHHEAQPSEVELYQAQPALGFDLDIAWNEAVLPGKLLSAEEPRLAARYPSAWDAARNVNLCSPFPCCIGMAPQFLQKIDRLLENSAAYFQQESMPLSSGFTAESTFDNKTILSQMAIARLAGDIEGVRRMIPQLDGELLQKNELAAELWFAGKREEAAEAWGNLESTHPVIAFNKGLSSLSLGRTSDGKRWLTAAAKGFDESTGWRHLAELYLAAAQ